MGGKGGGMFKPAPPSMPKVEMPTMAPPVPTAQEDAITVANEKAKQAKILAAMKGRQSTILTADKLGDVNINAPQALGA